MGAVREVGAWVFRTRRSRRRRASDFLCRCVAALLVLVAAGPALAENRVALVIGNGAYRAVPQLANPPNDAGDVAESLKTLGFTVTLGVDLDQAQMRRAIADFGKRAASADVSLFYYGGHGLQVSAHNYLIPVDAQFAPSTISTSARFISTTCSTRRPRGPAFISCFSTRAATIR